MPSMHAVFVQGFEKNINHICHFFQNNVLVTGVCFFNNQNNQSLFELFEVYSSN